MSDFDKSDLEATKRLLKLNWNPLKIEDKSYSYKSIFGEENTAMQILLLDLNELKLFYLNETNDEILEKCKEFNPSLDAPIGTILKHLSENLTMPNQINDKLFSLEYNNNNSKSPQKLASRGLKIIMNSKLKGAIKFKWEFNFKSLDLNLLREHPLYIWCCAEYQLREHELIRLLQAKDKELDDYKSQGHKLSRKHLNTDVFVIEAFDEQMRNKNDTNEVSNFPEKCLYTPLAHKINEICIPKYMNELTKPSANDVNPINDDQLTKTVDNEVVEKPNKLEKKSTASEKEMRKKELEKLKEEEEEKKTTKMQKKKKLF